MVTCRGKVRGNGARTLGRGRSPADQSIALEKTQRTSLLSPMPAGLDLVPGSVRRCSRRLMLGGPSKRRLGSPKGFRGRFQSSTIKLVGPNGRGIVAESPCVRVSGIRRSIHAPPNRGSTRFNLGSRGRKEVGTMPAADRTSPRVGVVFGGFDRMAVRSGQDDTEGGCGPGPAGGAARGGGTGLGAGFAIAAAGGRRARTGRGEGCVGHRPSRRSKGKERVGGSARTRSARLSRRLRPLDDGGWSSGPNSSCSGLRPSPRTARRVDPQRDRHRPPGTAERVRQALLGARSAGDARRDAERDRENGRIRATAMRRTGWYATRVTWSVCCGRKDGSSSLALASRSPRG